jgi:hypothetical protein
MSKYFLFFLLISFTATAQAQNDSLVKKKISIEPLGK